MSEPDSAVAGTNSPVVNIPVANSPIKRRRPLERALVWTLIAVLAVLASAETWSRYSFQRAYHFLGNRLEFGDEHTDEALDAAEVKSFLSDRKPSRTEDFLSAQKIMSNGATHLEVYSWFTLNPVKRREMFVYYDSFGPAQKEHPQVLSIQAVEEEFIPLISQREQQVMDRHAKNGTGPNLMMPGMPGGQALRELRERGSRRRQREAIKP